MEEFSDLVEIFETVLDNYDNRIYVDCAQVDEYGDGKVWIKTHGEDWKHHLIRNGEVTVNGKTIKFV